MQYDFLRRVLQKLISFEKNRKSLYFRLKNYPNKSIFKDNLIFTDNLNKAVVSFAVEIFPKKDAVQKTRCFTYRTTPAVTPNFRGYYPIFIILKKQLSERATNISQNLLRDLGILTNNNTYVCATRLIFMGEGWLSHC